jgi:hypothetical protein
MPFAPAPPLPLRPGDRETLEAMVRKGTLAQRLVFRARIILYCADGRLTGKSSVACTDMEGEMQ